MALITSDWVRMMARYNIWQNGCISHAMQTLSQDALLEDRGAYFGSILRTANHLIWGDTLWMARFEGDKTPATNPRDALDLYGSHTEWALARSAIDERIATWAGMLEDKDLEGQEKWYSGSQGREMNLPFAMCVTHFFNHQTHHRGQIHAMLTDAGAQTEDTDLIFMR